MTTRKIVLVELLRRLSNQRLVLKQLGKTQKLVQSMTPRAPEPAPPRITRKLSTRLDAAQVEQLAAAYASGQSTLDLANRYNISNSSVKKLLRDNNVASRTRGLTSAEGRQAQLLYAAGMTLDAIGARLGYSRKAVTNALRRH